MSLEQNKTAMIVEAARLYYEHAFSQEKIAKKLGISRPGVSRLLQRAREEGIVCIEIKDPSDEGTKLEADLKTKFELKNAIVVPDDVESTIIKQRLGQAAVKLLNQLVSEGMILGVSWGTTMHEVAVRVPVRPIRDMVVVQLNGGISRVSDDTRASEVAQKLGENFGATPYLLPLPAVVDNADLKEAIVSDKNISRTLALGREAKVAMFTIGSFGHHSILVKADYFESEDVESLLKQGAVADICSRIIKHNGEICSPELNARTISIELEDISKKAFSIAVAGGKEKLEAIRAGLRGKYFNILITDEWNAQELLQN
jgi:deoxyribonucleoside regulator